MMCSPERAQQIVHLIATNPRAAQLWMHLIYGTSMMSGSNYANYCKLKARARVNGLTIMQQRKEKS